MPAQPATSETTYDLLIQDGTVVSVFTGETFPADVAIQGETIVAILAPGSIDAGQAAEVVDARRLIIAPGYVDAHIHVEQFRDSPPRSPGSPCPEGTTTVLADPHEIVNVAGKPA